MFSYPEGVLQTPAAKRAENRFNGVDASSSGDPSQINAGRTTPAHVETAALRLRSGQALGCPAKAKPSGPTTLPSRPLMGPMNFLRWTPARTSLIVESLRRPALQPVPRS